MTTTTTTTTRAWWILGTCLLACSSTATATNGAADAGADADADAAEATDAGSDAAHEAGDDGGTGACNDLPNVAAPIQQMFVAADPPTPTGGTIVSGTYVMTGFTVYTGPDGGVGPTGLTLRDTATIDEAAGGTTYERVQFLTDDAGADAGAYHVSGTFTHLGGAHLQIGQTCPAGRVPFDQYDSDGTKLRFYAPLTATPLNPALMVEYTKQ